MERPLRQRDDVAREAVLTDVTRLPHLSGWSGRAQRVVQRAAVPRAATVALPVRADDENGIRDRVEGRVAAGERVGQVDVTEVVLVLHLEAEQALGTGCRRREEDAPAALCAPLGLLDEEKAGGPQQLEVLAQMSLELGRKEAAPEDVAPPGAAVLDEDPACRSGSRSRRAAPRACARGRAERPPPFHTLDRGAVLHRPG